MQEKPYAAAASPCCKAEHLGRWLRSLSGPWGPSVALHPWGCHQVHGDRNVWSASAGQLQWYMWRWKQRKAWQLAGTGLHLGFSVGLCARTVMCYLWRTWTGIWFASRGRTQSQALLCRMLVAQAPWLNPTQLRASPRCCLCSRRGLARLPPFQAVRATAPVRWLPPWAAAQTV